MKDDRLYLIHILECITRIEEYVGDTDETGFLANHMLQDAVIRNLQIMAESTHAFLNGSKKSTTKSTGAKLSGFAIS